MESEINEPELLDDCVRCHKSNEQLTKFSRRKALGTQGARFYRIYYSICENCKPHYEKGLKIQDRYATKKLKSMFAGISIVFYIIAIIVIFNSPISFEAMFPTIGILIGETFGSFFFILLLNRILYKTNHENL